MITSNLQRWISLDLMKWNEIEYPFVENIKFIIIWVEEDWQPESWLWWQPACSWPSCLPTISPAGAPGPAPPLSSRHTDWCPDCWWSRSAAACAPPAGTWSPHPPAGVNTRKIKSVGTDETTFVIGLKWKLGLVRTESNTIAAIYKHILFRGWYRNPIIIKT